jgi:hypothetical protein
MPNLYIERKPGLESEYIDNMRSCFKAAGFKSVSSETKADFVWLNWFEAFYGQDPKEKFEYKNHLLDTNYKNKKIIWTLHNKRPHDSTVEEEIMLMQELYNRASYILILNKKVSKSILKNFKKNSNNRPKLIYTPHPLNKIECDPNFLRSPSNDTLKLLSFGNKKLYKNFDLLEKVITDLKLDGLNIELTIPPHPTEKDELVKMILDAHLLVFPYNLNSVLNSGTYFFAAACKRQVIMPNIGSVQDIKKGVNDFIYEYPDPDSIPGSQIEDIEKRHYDILKNHITTIYNSYVGHFDDLIKLGEKPFKYCNAHNSKRVIIKNLKKIKPA